MQYSTYLKVLPSVLPHKLRSPNNHSGSGPALFTSRGTQNANIALETEEMKYYHIVHDGGYGGYRIVVKQRHANLLFQHEGWRRRDLGSRRSPGIEVHSLLLRSRGKMGLIGSFVTFFNFIFKYL